MKSILFEKVCGELEAQKHAQYLYKSNVPIFGELLSKGKLILKRGIISNIEFLGSLKTFTGIIPKEAIKSQIPCPPTNEFVGEKKYLVKEIIPHLDGLNISDNGHLDTIKRYKKSLLDDEGIEIIVTIFHKNKDFLIVDGNKRAVALYEVSRIKKQSEINLPVYVLEEHGT